MPKLRNVVTGVVKELPARYVGLYPYELVEDEVDISGYKSPALDGDGDGMIQDGTPFERPEGTELTDEQKVKAVKKSTKKSK
jgi:hypothetical protein